MSYITKPTLPRWYGRISINYLSVINQNHGNLTADFLIKKLKKGVNENPKDKLANGLNRRSVRVSKKTICLMLYLIGWETV